MQLTFSSKDTNKEQTVHSKSDNIEVMAFDDENKIIEELFDSLLSRYQIGLETQMRGSDFIFNCVNLFYYKYHKINFKCGGSYIGSLDWIKKNRTMFSLCDNNCFKFWWN